MRSARSPSASAQCDAGPDAPAEGRTLSWLILRPLQGLTLLERPAMICHYLMLQCFVLACHCSWGGFFFFRLNCFLPCATQELSFDQNKFVLLAQSQASLDVKCKFSDPMDGWGQWSRPVTRLVEANVGDGLETWLSLTGAHNNWLCRCYCAESPKLSWRPPSSSGLRLFLGHHL